MLIKETNQNKIYPNIDMEKTGLQLKRMLKMAGYKTKQIQQYLLLSCPQPIYRWYKGQILPSVDHLLMLSELLGVHMEELLVKKEKKSFDIVLDYEIRRGNSAHLVMYFERMKFFAT